MWMNRLKSAFVLEETDRIAELLNTMPPFETVQEMEDARFLLGQIKELYEHKKQQSAKAMLQLKHTQEFLQSSQPTPSASFNLKL